jgi:hypothetical protein
MMEEKKEKAVKAQTPLYAHDCKRCEFLGRINDMDAYRCENYEGAGHSYILRFSSEGADYASTRDFSDVIWNDVRGNFSYHVNLSKLDKIFISRMVLLKLHSLFIASSMDRPLETVAEYCRRIQGV